MPLFFSLVLGGLLVAYLVNHPPLSILCTDHSTPRQMRCNEMGLKEEVAVEEVL